MTTQTKNNAPYASALVIRSVTETGDRAYEMYQQNDISLDELNAICEGLLEAAEISYVDPFLADILVNRKADELNAASGRHQRRAVRHA